MAPTESPLNPPTESDLRDASGSIRRRRLGRSIGVQYRGQRNGQMLTMNDKASAGVGIGQTDEISLVIVGANQSTS